MKARYFLAMGAVGIVSAALVFLAGMKHEHKKPEVTVVKVESDIPKEKIPIPVVREEPVEHVAIVKTVKTVGTDEEEDFFKPVRGREIDKGPQPIIISEYDYRRQYSKCNELSLRYYQDDGILTDEEDRPIEQFSQIVGVDNLFDLEQTEEDEMFIFDPLMMTVYDIQIMHGIPIDQLFPGMDDENEVEED